MTRRSNVVPLHRGRPFSGVPVTRELNAREIEVLRRELAPIRARVELERIEQRKRRLNRFIGQAALWIVALSAIYFLFQLGRGVL